MERERGGVRKKKEEKKKKKYDSENKRNKDKGRNGATKKGRLQDKGTKGVGGETDTERETDKGR